MAYYTVGYIQDSASHLLNFYSSAYVGQFFALRLRLPTVDKHTAPVVALIYRRQSAPIVLSLLELGDSNNYPFLFSPTFISTCNVTDELHEKLEGTKVRNAQFTTCHSSYLYMSALLTATPQQYIRKKSTFTSTYFTFKY
jgi:hypothetical protein